MPSVVKEHLVKVSHPEEQQSIGILFLECLVLFEPGSNFDVVRYRFRGHDFQLSESDKFSSACTILPYKSGTLILSSAI